MKSLGCPLSPPMSLPTTTFVISISQLEYPWNNLHINNCRHFTIYILPTFDQQFMFFPNLCSLIGLFIGYYHQTLIYSFFFFRYHSPQRNLKLLNQKCKVKGLAADLQNQKENELLQESSYMYNKDFDLNFVLQNLKGNNSLHVYYWNAHNPQSLPCLYFELASYDYGFRIFYKSSKFNVTTSMKLHNQIVDFLKLHNHDRKK